RPGADTASVGIDSGLHLSSSAPVAVRDNIGVRTKNAKFTAELIEGHKGVTAVLVPFDPEDVWGDPPIRLAGGRHGWPVRGTLNGARFVGYVGDRWGRFFITIDREQRAAAGVRVGDTVALTLAPSRTPDAIAEAIEQSKATTQPRRVSPRAV